MNQFHPDAIRAAVAGEKITAAEQPPVVPELPENGFASAEEAMAFVASIGEALADQRLAMWAKYTDSGTAFCAEMQLAELKAKFQAMMGDQMEAHMGAFG